MVPVLEDDTEFLKLFKEGLGTGGAMFNDYQPNKTMSSGANVIQQMENKIQNFVIEIGDRVK